MRTAKRALFSVLITAMALPLFAQSVDYGGDIFNSTGVGNYSTIGDASTAPGLLQRDSLNLWFQGVFAENFTFSAQISGTLVYNPFSQPDLLLYLDPDLLALAGKIPAPQGGVSLFGFTLGRTLFSDFSGLVLSQKADGFSLEFGYPAFSVNLHAAYTGLVQKGASAIALSKADVNDVANANVYFASPRLFQSVMVRFPSLFGQELTLEGILQEDMRDTVLDLATPGTQDLIPAGSTTFDPARGGPVGSQYFGLGLGGRLADGLYYKLSSYAELYQDLVYASGAYGNTFAFALLGGLEIHYYIPSFLSSAAGAKLLYASGDPASVTPIEGNTRPFSSFTPISRVPLCYVFSPLLSNIALVETSYSLQPLTPLGAGLGKTLEARIRADIFFRVTPGAISEEGIPLGSQGMYLGSEGDLTLRWRPLSDVGITLWGGLFVPGDAFGAAPPLQYKAGVDASLSL
jgi:hypothetical protein